MRDAEEYAAFQAAANAAAKRVPTTPASTPPPTNALTPETMKTAAANAVGPAESTPTYVPRNTSIMSPSDFGIAPPKAPPLSADGKPGFMDIGLNAKPKLVSPAGMRPDSVQTKLGKPVPEEAKADYAAATGLETAAALDQRDADKSLYEQTARLEATKLAAVSDAERAHQDVQARRDSETQDRIADIEAINQQAAAQIDPEKFWHDRGAFASILGTIAVALGGASSAITKGPNPAQAIFDSAINRDIQAQVANRQNLHQVGQSQERLLDLHRRRLGDEDAAIDATRLALLDNIGTQIHVYAQNHAAQVSDVALNQVLSGIANRRAEVVRGIASQEANDVTLGSKWQAAQYTGGGTEASSKKLEEVLKQLKPGNTVVVPAYDTKHGKPVRVSISDEATATRLQKVGGAVGQIMKMNEDAEVLLLKREESFKDGDTKKYREYNAELNNIAERKVSVGSVQLEQGVTRDPEYLRSISKDVGWGSWDQVNPLARDAREQAKFLRAQNERIYREFAGGDVAAAGGSVVEDKFIHNPETGLPTKVQVETGRTYEPETVKPQVE